MPTKVEISTIRKASEISTEIMRELKDKIVPGADAADIDDLAGDLMRAQGVISSFLGVGEKGNEYMNNICIAVNDEVLHAIPHQDKIFHEGDLVKLDMGIVYEDAYTDHCITVGLAPVSTEDERLLRTAKLAVETGAKQAITGNKTGDIGEAIYKIVKSAGFDVLKYYIGHGIGSKLHLEPEIPAYGQRGTGDELKENMILCVEAQIVAGSDQVFTTSDGWTIKTTDGKKAAMFEYMVRVDAEPEFLTDTRNWELIVKSI